MDKRCLTMCCLKYRCVLAFQLMAVQSFGEHQGKLYLQLLRSLISMP